MGADGSNVFRIECEGIAQQYDSDFFSASMTRKIEKKNANSVRLDYSYFNGNCECASQAIFKSREADRNLCPHRILYSYFWHCLRLRGLTIDIVSIDDCVFVLAHSINIIGKITTSSMQMPFKLSLFNFSQTK